MSNPVEQRDGFKSKWGFILACIGSAVGMGNIWRFPIMVSKFGGLTFLIPYFIFVVLIGSTGVIEEFALGRWAAAGPVGAFGKCTALDIICLETLNDDAFTGDNGYSGECNGDTKLIIPAEDVPQQKKGARGRR